MRVAPDPKTDDDLDLPPMDGEGEEEVEGGTADDIDDTADAGDPFDDATGEGDAVVDEEIAAVAEEAGLLADAEGNAKLDVGPFDLATSDEEKLLEDDEPIGGANADDLNLIDEEGAVADAGEEGPLDADEELREEDLPALDADEEGDVDDASLYDRTALGAEEELRWDDRAWKRVEEPFAFADEPDDSGMLATPSEDATNARDVAWKRIEETGRVTAATFLADAVVVALEEPTRGVVIVRIHPDGVARIIAEIEGGEDARVSGLRWDAANGWLVVTGTFGTQAFRP